MVEHKIKIDRLIANLFDVIMVFDERGNIVFVSPSITRMFGFSVEEMLGKNGLEFIHPDDLQIIANKHREFLHSPKEIYIVRSLEYRHRHKNGGWVYVEAIGHNLLHDPEVNGVLLTMRNVTDRKRAETDLRTMADMLEAAPCAIIVHDFEGKILYVNRRALELHDYDRDELHALSLEDLNKAETKVLVKARLQMIREKGEARFEVVHERKDGSAVPLEVHVRTVEWKGASALLSTVTDLTERKLAEAEQKKSAERHRAILHTAMDGFWLVDTQGHLLEVNETYCRMSGYTSEELLTMRIQDLEAIETDQDVMTHVRKIMDLGEDRFETQHRRKDGGVFDVEVSVQYRMLDGGQTVVFVRDITERKRAESENTLLQKQLFQAQKMEAIGVLAGGIAHDFNNYLTTILCAIALIKMQSNSHDQLSQEVMEIEASAKKAAELTRNLLAFSRKQILKMVKADLNCIIHEFIGTVRHILGSSIEIEQNLGRNLWAACVDIAQIENIILNLVTNAKYAMDKGGTLTIETSNVHLDAPLPSCPDSYDGNFVLVTVADTGLGIPEDILPKIFEPFYTTKPNGEGTGMGLAMVYGSVRQHNGFIDIRTAVNQGTIFKLYFPASATGSIAPSDARKPFLTRLGSNKTILVVEDDLSVRRVIVRSLKSQGFQVIDAGNAGIAFLKLKKAKVDLVLTDIIMPEMNGIEFAKMLTVEHPDIKFLFMSGYTFKNEDLPVHHFLQKPFSISTLVEKIFEILDE